MASCPCGVFVAGDIDVKDIEDIEVALQDARRCLTRPQPSPGEATIYIERAMEIASHALR